MSQASNRSAVPAQQEVCIDLPGESVQCWRSSDSLKVVLRKHRDVIFDLRLGQGKKYTVQATHSDFYNARDKKLVFAKRNDIVTFNDGERMHLWVTRNFKGSLLLKCENKLMMRIEPNELDRHQYDKDPKTKPAPIIIALGEALGRPAPATHKPTVARQVAPSVPPSAAAPLDEDCSLICVLEGNPSGMPEDLVRHFKKGGGQKSGFADIDPFDVATRNWIWSQAAGAGAYIGDNWNWLKASVDGRTHTGFKLVKAKVHLVRGQVRFYFSGYSKFNTVFGPGGFGPGHDRIMNIFAGVGKTSSSFNAILKGVAGTFKKNALLSIIFSSATAYAEWKDGIGKDRYDLAASLLMSVLKGLIAAAITVAVIAVIIKVAMVVGAAALSVLAVGAMTIAAGFAVNYIVDALDKSIGRSVTGDKSSTDGLSTSLAPILRSTGKEIERSWKYLMSKFPKDYEEIDFARFGFH